MLFGVAMGHTGGVTRSNSSDMYDDAAAPCGGGLPEPYLRPAGGKVWQAEIVEKRSRFIAYARRTADEMAARAFIDEIRAEHPAARHHCPAYAIHQVGQNALRHSSDDGEPSGTAGRPILAVIDGAGLMDLTVVVVRYFGGTLLGTGGLVRAYTDATNAVLKTISVRRRVTRSAVELAVGHADAGRVEAELRGADGWEILDTAYDGAGARLTVMIGAERSASELAGMVAAMLGRPVELVDAGMHATDEVARNPLA